MRQRLYILPVLLFSLTACARATPGEKAAKASYQRARATQNAAHLAPPSQPEELDGSLRAYLRFALDHSPRLKARMKDWEASVHGIDTADRLPEPQVQYAWYAQSVETRVGPQRHRASVRQNLPWHTQLSTRRQTALSTARLMETRARTQRLKLAHEIRLLYWTLRANEAYEKIHRDKLALLQDLFASAKIRVEAAGAPLSDLQEIQLKMVRQEDKIAQILTRRQEVHHGLRAAMGAPPALSIRSPADDFPQEAPKDIQEMLHPRIQELQERAQVEKSRAKQARQDRYPTLQIGLDWIETGEALADTPDNGKDAVVLSLGTSLPVWTDDYQSGEDAANARAEAHEARATDLQQVQTAQRQNALLTCQDATRSIALYRHELIPQTHALYTSRATQYQAGEASLEKILMTYQDLLDLELDLIRAREARARAISTLQYLQATEDSP